MTKCNIKSSQGVIILYQLNYNELWWFLGLIDSYWLVLIRIDSCWLVSNSCWLLSDLCWFVLTCVRLVLIRVDSCWTRADLCQTRVDSCWLVSNSCWFVLTRVDSCWHSCIRIDLINISYSFLMTFVGQVERKENTNNSESGWSKTKIYINERFLSGSF